MESKRTIEASQQELLNAIGEEHGRGVFVDRLLMAIIEAHPDPASKRSSLERLNDARRALLGERGAARLKRHPRDRDALLYMAEHYMNDRGGAHVMSTRRTSFKERVDSEPVGARSVAVLAKEAAQRFRSSSARRLENLFGANKLSLCLTLIQESDVAPSLQNQALLEIRDMLSPWNIPLKLE